MATHSTKDHAHGAAAHGHMHTKLYLVTALILCVLTALEVALYESSFRANTLFIPLLIVMSAVKFALVVALYMHLKFDDKLFTQLFTGPLIIAGCTLVALLFLFGQVAL
jgi:cytochrome c oxidase subunit IV